MEFQFNERKATAAAAEIISLHGGRMKYLRLLKLLYIADRECLGAYGFPITGDDYVAMKRGPVLSIVYNLIKEEKTCAGFWQEHIRTDGYEVTVHTEPGRGPLSKADLEILQRVVSANERRNEWEIVDLTHDFPEWEHPGNSSVKIRPEKILKALGKTEAEIREVAKDAATSSYFQELFGACCGCC